MAITRTKKEQVVERLNGIMQDAESFVFANFHGLSVAQANEMRMGLAAQGVSYYVAKKTLIKRAIDSAPFEGTLPALEGEIAIAYGADPIAPAREIKTFAKQFDGAVEIVGGMYDQTLLDKAQMEEIAAIPSYETLQAQFLNVINSPIQRLAIAMDQIAQSRA